MIWFFYLGTDSELRKCSKRIYCYDVHMHNTYDLPYLAWGPIESFRFNRNVWSVAVFKHPDEMHLDPIGSRQAQGQLIGSPHSPQEEGGRGSQLQTLRFASSPWPFAHLASRCARGSPQGTRGNPQGTRSSPQGTRGGPQVVHEAWRVAFSESLYKSDPAGAVVAFGSGHDPLPLKKLDLQAFGHQ